MDQDNIAFYFHDEKDGYPTSGWGESVLDAMRHPDGQTPKGRRERFRLLFEIYQRSDDDHTEALDLVFGLPMRKFLVAWRAGWVSDREGMIGLEPILEVLPFLIYSAFGDVQQAVRDYANTSPATKWLG